MKTINKEEYELLKSLDSQWKWIARDDEDNYGGHLFAYSEKTFKNYDEEYWDCSQGIFSINNDLFQFVKWEDEEPYDIAELIREYEESYFWLKNNFNTCIGQPNIKAVEENEK